MKCAARFAERKADAVPSLPIPSRDSGIMRIVESISKQIASLDAYTNFIYVGIGGESQESRERQGEARSR